MLENEIDKMLNNSDSADSHNHKRKSLGRGLGALLGEDDLDLDNVEDLSSLAPAPATANLVDIDLIKPGKFQPRTEFDQEALQSLAESIKEKGVLQPLLVRRDGIGFEIIAGERRWRASKLAGLDKVPVIEKDLSDKEVLEVALVENLLRENLSAIEEAEGLQRLIDEFSHTQEALSQIIGKAICVPDRDYPACAITSASSGKRSATGKRRQIECRACPGFGWLGKCRNFGTANCCQRPERAAS